MLGKIKNYRWTDTGGPNRDLFFVSMILTFGIIMVAKLAPYAQKNSDVKTVNRVQTSPGAVPIGIAAALTAPLMRSYSKDSKGHPSSESYPTRKLRSDRSSVIERPLFDGQWAIVRVVSTSEYLSTDPAKPFEVQITGACQTERDIDLSPVMGAKLIGSATPNMAAKRLYANFSEMAGPDGRSYRLLAQAISGENHTSGIAGDYSSGFGKRMLGLVLDRAIFAADQVGTASLYNAIGPVGVVGQEFRAVALQTSQIASQGVSNELTKDLRETTPEIRLPAGTTFCVRLRAAQEGASR